MDDRERLHALHHRHPQVHQHDFRFQQAAFFHAFQAVLGLMRFIAGLAHDFAQQVPHIQFIIDDQDPFRLFQALSSSTFPAGKLSTNELPAPGADSTWIVPPQVSINRNATDSPNPVPCSFVVKNGSKIRS